MAPQQRKGKDKGPDSAKGKEKDAKKDDKKAVEDEKELNFIQRMQKKLEKHVLKVQIGLMFMAFLFSVIPRYLQGHDSYRFDDSYKDPVAWYTQFAQDYNSILVGKWNYSLHINVSERLHQHVGHAKAEAATVLDVGSGSGLVGKELKRLGFQHVTGVDVVQEMVAVANATGAYERVVATDVEGILAPMSFLNSSFDAVLCVGTAGYLGRGESDEFGPILDRTREKDKPQAEASRLDKLLKEWLRMLKPGGYLGITLETSLMVSWQEAFHEMVQAGSLAALGTSVPLDFVPGNGDVYTASEKVHMYFYQKPEQQ